MDSGDGLKGEEKVAYDRYVAYRSLMNGWRAQGKDLSALAPADIAQLEDFAAGTDLTAVSAYALLRQQGAVGERLRELYLPDEGKRLMNGKIPTTESEGILRLFPNPADEYVTVEYRIDKAFKKASLRMVDSKGVVVYTAEVFRSSDQFLIALNLESANYQCELIVDGVSYRTTQFNVR